MKAKAFLGGVLVVALIVATAGAAAQTAEKPSQALLQKAKSIEAFITGQFKFIRPGSDGKTFVDWDTLAHFGAGNISTDKMTEKKAPVWNGRQFTAEASEKDARGETTAVSLKGALSADFAAIETLVAKKTVTKANGDVTSVQWTFKGLPGKVYQNPYTRKKTVSYGDIYPVEQSAAHLSAVIFSEKRGGQGEVTFGGLPTLAEIEAEYKDSAYLDSYKRVQFDVKFVID
jgi:hypothetical protein